MRKKRQGYITVFLETDLEKSKPFNEKSLTDIERQVLVQLSSAEQEKVRKGYATSVVDLESGETICGFNREGWKPPKSAIDSMARALLPAIQEFYSKAENREAYEYWKKEQSGEKKPSGD